MSRDSDAPYLRSKRLVTSWDADCTSRKIQSMQQRRRAGSGLMAAMEATFLKQRASSFVILVKTR
jgi:hypothetical protein